MHPADYQSPKSIFIDGVQSAGITAPDNSYFYRLQFFQPTTFTTLIAATGAHCIGSNYSNTLTGMGAGATAVTTTNFTGLSGTDIIGKWSSFRLLTGRVIAYYS